MSWFQENKFAGTVLTITAVVSGALVYLGISARSELNLAKERELGAVEKINMLQASETYPNEENQTELISNLRSFASNAKLFQEDLLKFRPKEMKQLSPDQFNSVVSNYFKSLDKYYKDKGIEFRSDDKQYYGLGRYAGSMAKETDTAYLNYHRKALEWLFISLADSGIEKLEHVYREPVAEKMSEVPEEVMKPKRGGSAVPAEEAVSELLPIEITFTGTEQNLQTFLTKVASSKEHFFSVKLLKILNEQRDPISISNKSFAPEVEAAPVEESATDSFEVEFDLPGDETFNEDLTIIKQVVGSEKITVFMKLNLVLFKKASSVVIPGLEKSSNVKK